MAKTEAAALDVEGIIDEPGQTVGDPSRGVNGRSLAGRITPESVSAFTLDVDRLARALHAAECECDYWPGEHQPKWGGRAKSIAAEYARLLREVPA